MGILHCGDVLLLFFIPIFNYLSSTATKEELAVWEWIQLKVLLDNSGKVNHWTFDKFMCKIIIWKTKMD